MTGQLFAIIVLIIGVLSIVVGYLRGKRALSIFPDIRSVTIRYRDFSASGYSTKSWKTKLGGVNGALEIVVTDDELWTKSMVYVASICQYYDLLHKIPLSNIMRIEHTGKKVTVDFITINGEKKQIVLITKNPDEFIRVLGESVNVK